MVRQLLVALVLTSLTVVIHAFGTVRIVLPAIGYRRVSAESGPLPGPVAMIIRLVSGLLVLHLLEMALWAATFYGIGIFPDFETSLYYSLKSYTTVGYGDVLPPPSWRLVGPIEAAVGILMLGVSTSIIVAVLQRIHNRHLN